jgi:ferredoxin
MLVIDPDDCIDCAVCVPECPVNAIFAHEDLPKGQEGYTALNAELSPQWKPIVRTKKPLADADEWAAVQDKRHLLQR